jgi:hypothetical protein
LAEFGHSLGSVMGFLLDFVLIHAALAPDSLRWVQLEYTGKEFADQGLHHPKGVLE